MLSDFSRYFKFKKSRYLYSESTIKYSVFSIQFCGFDLCFNISVWCLGMLSCLLLINLVSFHWYLASFKFLQFFNYSSSFETSPGVVYFCMCMKILRSVLHPRVLLTATNITYSQPLRAQLHPHIKDFTAGNREDKTVSVVQGYKKKDILKKCPRDLAMQNSP